MIIEDVPVSTEVIKMEGGVKEMEGGRKKLRGVKAMEGGSMGGGDV